jgi:hypothetical protein
VGTIAAPETSFSDTTVSGTATYYYVVRSLQPCESGDSLEAGASTTGACTLAPGFSGLAAVTNAEASTCTLDLSWPAASAYCGGPASYAVHRSPTAPFTPSPGNTVVTGLSGTSYADHDALADGAVYHYIVRATDLASGLEEDNTVSLSASPTGPSTVGTWSDDGGDSGPAKLVPSPPWSVQASGGKTGPGVYATGTYTNDLCTALTTPVLTLQSGSVLSFATKYDIESGWDAGIVEVAEGPGFDQWIKLTTVNYPDLLSNSGNACGFPSSGPGTVFSWYSFSPTYPVSDYSGSLAAYAGKEIQLRWRLSTDLTGTGQGWWIDDVAVTDAVFWSVCSSAGMPNPKEVSPAGAPLWAWPGPTGSGIELSYTPGCGALDNAAYWGTGPIAGTPIWTGAACSLGNTGTASFDPGDPAPGAFLYFVIVGQNGIKEGSYGQSFDGTAQAERPEAVGIGACDLPQDLSGACP